MVKASDTWVMSPRDVLELKAMREELEMRNGTGLKIRDDGKSSTKVCDASFRGKVSTRDERDRKGMKHKSQSRGISKRPKHSPTVAGQSHKEKDAKLKRNQNTRLVPGTHSPRKAPLFRESHTEVLLGFINDAIALRNTWSEAELDNLWKGVRRHGLQNWEKMLQDSDLMFSKSKTAEDLEAAWYRQDLAGAFPRLNGI